MDQMFPQVVNEMMNNGTLNHNSAQFLHTRYSQSKNKLLNTLASMYPNGCLDNQVYQFLVNACNATLSSQIQQPMPQQQMYGYNQIQPQGGLTNMQPMQGVNPNIMSGNMGANNPYRDPNAQPQPQVAPTPDPQPTTTPVPRPQSNTGMVNTKFKNPEQIYSKPRNLNNSVFKGVLDERKTSAGQTISILNLQTDRAFLDEFELVEYLKRTIIRNLHHKNAIVFCDFMKLEVLDAKKNKFLELVKAILNKRQNDQVKVELGCLEMILNTFKESLVGPTTELSRLMLNRFNELSESGKLVTSDTSNMTVSLDKLEEVLEMGDPGTSDPLFQQVQQIPEFMDTLKNIAQVCFYGLIESMEVCDMSKSNEMNEIFRALNGFIWQDGYTPEDVPYLETGVRLPNCPDAEKLKVTLNTLKKKLDEKTVVKLPRILCWTNMHEPSMLVKNDRGNYTATVTQVPSDDIRWAIANRPEFDSTSNMRLIMDPGGPELFMFLVGVTMNNCIFTIPRNFQKY